MPDFNLYQFKAGRIAIDRYGNHYRFLALIKNEFFPLVVAKIIYLGQELPYPCSIEGKIDDDVILKMKPDKKKLYIVVSSEKNDRGFYMSTYAHSNKDQFDSHTIAFGQIVEVDIDV